MSRLADPLTLYKRAEHSYLRGPWPVSPPSEGRSTVRGNVVTLRGFGGELLGTFEAQPGTFPGDLLMVRTDAGDWRRS